MHAALVLHFRACKSWLTRTVSSEGASLEEFMEDARKALEGGQGFLFEDDNSAGFIESLNAMGDFEAFHALMMKHASNGGSVQGFGRK